MVRCRSASTFGGHSEYSALDIGIFEILNYDVFTAMAGGVRFYTYLLRAGAEAQAK